jgi:malonyl CoA-acyl carrier protein transacylase
MVEVGDVILATGETEGELARDLQDAIRKVEAQGLAVAAAASRSRPARGLRLAVACPAPGAVAHLQQVAALLADPAKRAGLATKGAFLGSGAPAGKVAFLFPGQGCQYPNMLRDVAERHAVVRATFEEADRVLAPLLGRRLTDILFVDPADATAVERAEAALRETETTQPAILAADVAMLRLLESLGLRPDVVAGHSLGEYAALVAAGVLSFEHALVAVSSRGREMAHVDVPDKGMMASVAADAATVEALLAELGGDVVAANKNSPRQTVIAGGTAAVQRAMAELEARGLAVVPVKVSAAFHTSIVSPSIGPLRSVLETLAYRPAAIPVSCNVTGGYYPPQPSAVLDILARHAAAPVEWQAQLESMHADGVRTFVEVGPKRILTRFVEDTLGARGVAAVATNHPKRGGVLSLLDGLAQLLALGVPLRLEGLGAAAAPAPTPAPRAAPEATQGSPLGQPLHLAELERRLRRLEALRFCTEEIVVSGAAVGLPGASRKVFSDDNVARLLQGENRIERIGDAEARAFLDKNIVRVVKGEGEATFERVQRPEQALHLAGRRGAFDLRDYGLDGSHDALDVTARLALGAALEALKDAGIPLVREEVQTSTGRRLPGGWALPREMQEETAVVFASVFPGLDSLVDDLSRHFAARQGAQGAKEVLDHYAALAATVQDPDAKRHLADWLREHGHLLGGDGPPAAATLFEFSRKFIFRVMAFGHAYVAEALKARGPNVHVNSACASTSVAIATAEDWIRTGRAKRVIVVAADDATSSNLLPWLGSAFLAAGAATTAATVEEGALPFDRRRHGMILGMGAVGFVLEARSLCEERGTIPVAALVATEIANSAFHGSRLDTHHVAEAMRRLVGRAAAAENRRPEELAGDLLFMSHETATPARGGSASAEVASLRRAFGPAAGNVLVVNTKGYTGHPMGAGIEDVAALKCLQYGRAPPIANHREADPELGELLLSKGGPHERTYALRFAAGFGSQVAVTLFRREARQDARVLDPARRAAWLQRIGGADAREALHGRVLRLERPSAPAVHVHAAPDPEVRAVGGAQPHAAPPAPKPAATAAAPAPSILQTITAILAKATGLPPDVLEPGLDLEGDLAVDTIKQAEVFAEVRRAFGIPRVAGLQVKDYPTLGHLVGFVEAHAPRAAPAALQEAAAATTTAAPAAAPPAPTATALRRQAIVPAAAPAVPDPGSLDGQPVELSVLDPALDALAQELADQLRAAGVRVWKPNGVSTPQPPAASAVVLLPPTGEEGTVAEAAFRAALAARARAIAPGATLLLAVQGDGPDALACAGLARALAREYPQANVRAVALEGLSLREAAAALAEELAVRGGPAAVVRSPLGRFAELAVAAVSDAPAPPFPLHAGDLVVVTGGAAGITFEGACALAREVRGLRFLLLGRSEPRADAASLADLDEAAWAAKAEQVRLERAQRGEPATPAEVERALAPLRRAAGIHRALAALRGLGAEAEYRALDVADTAALADAVAQARSRGGPVRGILHGAGVEESRRFDRKDEGALARSWRPKVAGARALAAATANDPLAFFLMYGSMVGLYGNAGQADYCATNAALVAVARDLRSRGVPARVLAWTAWRETGMASRGRALAFLEGAGVDPVSNAEGAAALVEEVRRAGEGHPAVILSKALGTYQPGVAATAPRAVPVGEAGWLLDEARAAPTHVHARRRLDPAQDWFLADHQVAGVPYLPGVIGLEAFGQAARLLLPHLQAVAVRDARFMAPVKVQGPLTVGVDLALAGVLPDGRVLARGTLAVQGPSSPGTPSFSATLVLAPAPDLPGPKAATPEGGPTWALEGGDLYGPLFHGPTFRVLERVEGRPSGAATATGAGPDLGPAVGRLATSPLVTEALMQACVVAGIAAGGHLSLPTGIGSVELPADPACSPGGLRLTTRVLGTEGAATDYAAEAVDAAGRVVARMDRLRLVRTGPRLEASFRRAEIAA